MTEKRSSLHHFFEEKEGDTINYSTGWQQS